MNIQNLNIKNKKIVTGGSNTYTPILENKFKYPADYVGVYNQLNDKQKSIVDYFSYLKKDIKIICSDFTNDWVSVIDKSIELIDNNLRENNMNEFGLYPGIDSYLVLTDRIKKYSDKKSTSKCNCKPDEKLSYTPCSIFLISLLLIISNDEPEFEGNVWLCVLIMVRRWNSKVGSLDKNILNYYMNSYEKELSGKFKKEEIFSFRRLILSDSSVQRYKSLKIKLDEVNKNFSLINDKLFKELNDDKIFVTHTIGIVTIASLMIMKNN